jgi:uncharacterized surface protein with fasciclin (FAS1) repeats
MGITEGLEMTKKYDIIEIAKQVGHFRVFLQALESVGLTRTLKESGPYTVFAPVDDAFMKVPKATLESLFKIENRESLQLFLRNHIILADLPISELKRVGEVKNAKGDDLRIDSGAGLKVNEVEVVTADLLATNGVLYGIDAVLMPQMQVVGAS